MAVYQPKYKDPNTGETLTANVWWMDFRMCGRRIRESTGCSRKTLAVEAVKRRKLELERAIAGLPTERKELRIRTVAEVCSAYRESYGHGKRPKSIAWVNERLAPLLRYLSSVVLPDLTEARIREYVKARQTEGAGGRTINMEIGILSRAVGRNRGELWPKVKPLHENRDVGKALAPDEESRLLYAAIASPSPLIGPFIRIALTTGMRCGEILGLTWDRVDLIARTLTVGQSKTAAGTGRGIPMNEDLYQVVLSFAEWHRQACGGVASGRYLFPFCVKTGVYDSTRRLVNIRKAWEAVRDAAGVSIRIHDLRHSACTKMAEAGVSEFGMMAIMGHVSRAMLERYSHVRMDAKRVAVEALSLSGVVPKEVLQKTMVKEITKVDAIQ